jgi:DNA polymerase-3 subunit delta
MNITPHDLSRQLKQEPRKTFLYLITGDETLLVEESIHAISAKAKTEGYEERHVIESNEADGLDLFLSHTQNLSFFSLKKIIEIRFHQKVSAAWSKLFVEITQTPDSNQIIIVRTPKLSKAETQEKWYKAVDQTGCIVTIWPLKQDTLLRWIHARCESVGIAIQRESIAHIAANTEGNLLAASQAIEKLKLIQGTSSSPIPHETVAEMLSDQTHYTVFDLSDAALAQKPSQCLKILSTLKHQDMEPPIILWALMQDIRHLAALAAVPPNTRASLYPRRGIFGPRQALFQKALSTISASRFADFVQKAKNIDESIKGIQPGNVWIDLENLCLALSGVKQ